MNEQIPSDIKAYLRQGETQSRVWQSIQQARQNITVTISRAASLFGFSESKLREWEKRGLLQTERPVLAQEGKGATGHRQYTQAELDKLAIIKDLLDHGYALGDIPPDVDKLWTEIVGGAVRGQANMFPHTVEVGAAKQLPIDARVEQTDQQEFWRYFVTQVLRISLALICEDIPDTLSAGLILPLQNRQFARAIKTTSDLAQAGPALVGWQGKDGSFSTFLDDAPTFEYPSDFRLETLLPANLPSSGEDAVLENLLIVMQRRARQLVLAPERVEALLRLLKLVSAHVDDWRPCFSYGRRDWLYQAHNLNAPGESTMLNRLAEQVIELGATVPGGQSRWNFCVLLLPKDASLPVQQQSLIVRAQTRNSPFEIGLTTISPHQDEQANSLALKAFQSGQIVSVQAALTDDSMTRPLRLRVITSTPQTMAKRAQEKAAQKPSAGEAVHSALAIPIIGDNGISIAVLYIEAQEAGAFSQEDQRVLRIIGRMVEEWLLAARARNQAMDRQGNMVDNPMIVDTTFEGFAVEADFLAEIDALLSRLQNMPEEQAREEISIISIDIDNQSSVAMKYGNRVARNLSQQVGLRVRGQMRTVSHFQPNKLFHVSADKYYLLLEGLSLDEACSQARQLRNALSGGYRILPMSATPGRPALPENMLEVPGVTVHIGVSSYFLEKLDELLRRYPLDTSKIYVRTLIMAGIEEMLERGKNAGGNCIIAWDRESWGYKPLA